MANETRKASRPERTSGEPPQSLNKIDRILIISVLGTILMAFVFIAIRPGDDLDFRDKENIFFIVDR